MATADLTAFSLSIKFQCRTECDYKAQHHAPCMCIDVLAEKCCTTSHSSICCQLAACLQSPYIVTAKVHTIAAKVHTITVKVHTIAVAFHQLLCRLQHLLCAGQQTLSSSYIFQLQSDNCDRLRCCKSGLAKAKAKVGQQTSFGHS